MLTIFGPVYAFASTALIYALAAVPMFRALRMVVEREAQLSREAKVFASGLAFSDGLVAAAVNFGWRIVLFQTLGESFKDYGGALAMAGLVGAVVGLVGGRLTGCKC